MKQIATVVISQGAVRGLTPEVTIQEPPIGGIPNLRDSRVTNSINEPAGRTTGVNVPVAVVSYTPNAVNLLPEQIVKADFRNQDVILTKAILPIPVPVKRYYGGPVPIQNGSF